MTDEIQRRQIARLDAMARVSATDEVVNGLRRDLTAMDVPEDALEALVAAAKALLPVARRAGVELTVGVDRWSVRVAEDEVAPAGTHSDVAVQLAQVLRRDGGVPR
jgi:hypothetical protein